MVSKIIEWQYDKTPRSKVFDDVYFSSDDGLAESKAVFLNGIGAPEIWQNKNNFTINELGFGTGLNFLLTVKLWLETTSKNQKLFYRATELYPLNKSDIEKALYWAELRQYRDHLLEKYPLDEIELFEGRVFLKLLVGDSLDMLKQEDRETDAWYLDGFAPSKNPGMWSNDLFKQVARLTKKDGVIATFTAAGFVRRGLNYVGFHMSKRPGFGKKREMLSGIYSKNIDVV